MQVSDEAVLHTLLRLRPSSRFGFEQRVRSGHRFVLVRCPAGLSFMADDVRVLDGLATAVMDARAALLRDLGEGYRCGEESPDGVQRRFTALGIGWVDPDPEGEVIDDGLAWLTTEQAAEVLGVAVSTLRSSWATRGIGPERHRIDGRWYYRRAEVQAFREGRQVA